VLQFRRRLAGRRGSTLLRAEVERAGLHDLHADVPAEDETTGALFKRLQRRQVPVAQEEIEW